MMRFVVALLALLPEAPADIEDGPPPPPPPSPMPVRELVLDDDI